MTVEVAMLWGSAALTRKTRLRRDGMRAVPNYLYATWIRCAETPASTSTIPASGLPRPRATGATDQCRAVHRTARGRRRAPSSPRPGGPRHGRAPASPEIAPDGVPELGVAATSANRGAAKSSKPAPRRGRFQYSPTNTLRKIRPLPLLPAVLRDPKHLRERLTRRSRTPWGRGLRSGTRGAAARARRSRRSRHRR